MPVPGSCVLGSSELSVGLVLDGSGSGLSSGVSSTVGGGVHLVVGVQVGSGAHVDVGVHAGVVVLVGSGVHVGSLVVGTDVDVGAGVVVLEVVVLEVVELFRVRVGVVVRDVVDEVVDEAVAVELVVAGAGTATGSWPRPSATAEVPVAKMPARARATPSTTLMPHARRRGRA
ncbi:hypothetical protein AWH69_05345 [Janibacter melonis]|uniref:Uncharacterized protein n=1 Tax=Janibacter melonis TaxID=262209 RepID=A0A176QCU5_9MICO|nr:hypothetical protein AWH69_05345 [Janibacter melonis]